MMAFWVGIGTALVYGALMLGLSCVSAYGYTGHWPVYYWPLLLLSAFAGVCKGSEAARKYEE